MIEWRAGKRFSCRRALQFVLVISGHFQNLSAASTRHARDTSRALRSTPSRLEQPSQMAGAAGISGRPAHYETAWRPAAQARNAAARRISENCASDNRSAPPRSATCPRIRSWKRRLHADLASPLMNNCRPLVMADRGRLLRDVRVTRSPDRHHIPVRLRVQIPSCIVRPNPWPQHEKQAGRAFAVSARKPSAAANRGQ